MIDSTIIATVTVQTLNRFVFIIPIITMVFTAGGLYVYVRFSLTELNKKIDSMASNREVFKKELREDIKDRNYLEDKNREKLDHKIEEYINRTYQRMDKLSVDVMNKMDDMKRDFVSVEHLKSITSNFQEQVRDLQNNHN